MYEYYLWKNYLRCLFKTQIIVLKSESEDLRNGAKEAAFLFGSQMLLDHLKTLPSNSFSGNFKFPFATLTCPIYHSFSYMVSKQKVQTSNILSPFMIFLRQHCLLWFYLNLILYNNLHPTLRKFS